MRATRWRSSPSTGSRPRSCATSGLAWRRHADARTRDGVRADAPMTGVHARSAPAWAPYCQLIAPLRRSDPPRYPSEEATMIEQRSGWVTFAGVLLLIGGVLNVIYGIAAIGNSSFFVNNTQ